MNLQLWLVLSLLLPVALAQGIGVSPDKLSIDAGSTARMWLINPANHPITAGIHPCDGLTAPSSVDISSHSREPIDIAAAPDASDCSSIMVMVIHSGNTGVAVLPSISVPVTVALKDSYKVRGMIPSPKPPSRIHGAVLSASVVIAGLALFYAFPRFSSHHH